MNVSNRNKAAKSLATHSFMPKVGYQDHGGPALANPGKFPPGLCSPPAGALDGSFHMLRSPHGKALVFRWVNAQKTWAVIGGARLKANRLGFKDDYLSRAGWTYLSTAQVN